MSAKLISRQARKHRAQVAAHRVIAGEKAVAIAHEIGVHVTTVYAWVRKARNA